MYFLTDSPVSDVRPSSVVNVGDEVLLRCSVEFGAPSNTSTGMTPQQFPRLRMTLNDLELATATQQYMDGQPAQRPHTLTRVSRPHSVSLCPCVCLSVCLLMTLNDLELTTATRQYADTTA